MVCAEADMAQALIIDAHHAIPGDELTIQASRASGPGGQHVNTTDTRVQVRWDLAASRAFTTEEKQHLTTRLASRLTGEGILVVACDTHRSQRRNREEALERLSALVRQGLHRPRPRRTTAMPDSVRRERRRQKQRRAQVKRDRRLPDDDA
jgi:ribosome-associated protein